MLGPKFVKVDDMKVGIRFNIETPEQFDDYGGLNLRKFVCKLFGYDESYDFSESEGISYLSNVGMIGDTKYRSFLEMITYFILHCKNYHVSKFKPNQTLTLIYTVKESKTLATESMDEDKKFILSYGRKYNFVENYETITFQEFLDRYAAKYIARINRKFKEKFTL